MYFLAALVPCFNFLLELCIFNLLLWEINAITTESLHFHAVL
jgi:hypothetical protein